MTDLTARQLTLAYDNAVIVENLDVRIPHGQVTALVGPNGCGKSTLLRGISRLLQPKGGTVMLDSRDIWSLKTKELAKQMGILPQGPVAPEGLTVLELVSQGRYPHQSWFRQWSAEDERACWDALNITGMDEYAHRPVETLSGGQRQRAWIAMTLAQDSEYILLDEPTTYLDMAYQIDVLDLLHDLNRQRGKTIVMVLHDLNQAARYADHLIAIRDGQVVCEGNPAHVVTEANIRSVFGLDCCIVADPMTGTPMVIPCSRAGRSCRAPLAQVCEPAACPLVAETA